MPKYNFNKVAKHYCNFIETALRHGCSPVNLLHIFRTPFPKNTSVGLLLRQGKKFQISFFCFLQVECHHYDNIRRLKK